MMPAVSHRPAVLALLLALSACERAPEPASPAPTPAVPTTTVAAPPAGVVLDDTEQLWTEAKISGRRYPLWIALPPDYAAEPMRRYPVLYLTDAHYSFPLVRSLGRMLGQRGRHLEPFILVGLPPQQGLDAMRSRSRDYTPTAPARDTPGLYAAPEYGQAAQYRDFLADTVLPLIDARYRTAPGQRVFAGHSYGGLFGSYVLLTRPELFDSYILSSPSLWFDHRVIDRIEADYHASHDRLDARVLLYIGDYERPGPDPRHNRRSDMVGDNRRFVARLRARGYQGLRIDSAVIADEDHLSAYPTAMTRALRLLFAAGRPPFREN